MTRLRLKTKVYQSRSGRNRGKWFWTHPSEVDKHGPFPSRLVALDAATAAAITSRVRVERPKAIGPVIFGYNPSSEASLRALCALLQRSLIRDEPAIVPLEVVKDVVPLLIPVVPTAVRLAERQAIDNLVEKLALVPKTQGKKKRRTARRAKRRRKK